MAIAFCALCTFGSAYATDECSGGPNGGMGASGNDCSEPDAYTASAPAQTATPVVASTATNTFSRPALERVVHPQPRAARHHNTKGSPQQVPISDVKP